MYASPTGGLVLPAPQAAARQVAMGARNHFSGTLVCGDDEGQAIDVESHLEMQVGLVMLARQDVVHLEPQVPSPWVDRHGARRTHFFDFRLTLRDGTRVALIVKPAAKAQDPGFRDITARVAAHVTPAVADRVFVITERDLDPIELHNAELLHSCRAPDPEVDATARRLALNICGAARIDTLTRTMGRAVAGSGEGWHPNAGERAAGFDRAQGAWNSSTVR